MSKCTWFSRNRLVSSILTLIFCGILFLTCGSKANANTTFVPPGDDIQAAIKAALGNTIVLQAGATYQTTYDYTPHSLATKRSGSSHITITS